MLAAGLLHLSQNDEEKLLCGSVFRYQKMVARNSRLLKHSGGVICRGVEFSLLKAPCPDEEWIDLFIVLFEGQ